MEPIFLTTDEYENIKKNKKYIGSGVDGSIYRISKDSIYKFYHKENNYIDIPNAIKDEDGVIINDFKSLRPYNKKKVNENIQYLDTEGVILTREDAIYKAIEKQENVQMTDLPKNPIYVNNKIAGCEYKYYPHKLGIYACAYLPLKQRLLVCNRILSKVKELLDNNIYPVTLAQRDDFLPFKANGSNILIGKDLNPIIIDLDGISALYSDKFSKRYYNRVMVSLSSLLLELITRADLANSIEDDEYLINEYINQMIKAGIPPLLARKFFDYTSLNMDDLTHIVKSLEKRKK